MTIEEIAVELHDFVQGKELDARMESVLFTMVQANVSYDNAEQFCEDHFIMGDVAKHYKEFYQLIMKKKQDNTPDPFEEIDQCIDEIRDRLATIEVIMARVRK